MGKQKCMKGLGLIDTVGMRGRLQCCGVRRVYRCKILEQICVPIIDIIIEITFLATYLNSCNKI